jgi:hypothetical protein
MTRRRHSPVGSHEAAHEAAQAAAQTKALEAAARAAEARAVEAEANARAAKARADLAELDADEAEASYQQMMDLDPEYLEWGRSHPAVPPGLRHRVNGRIVYGRIFNLRD